MDSNDKFMVCLAVITIFALSGMFVSHLFGWV